MSLATWRLRNKLQHEKASKWLCTIYILLCSYSKSIKITSMFCMYVLVCTSMSTLYCFISTLMTTDDDFVHLLQRFLDQYDIFICYCLFECVSLILCSTSVPFLAFIQSSSPILPSNILFFGALSNMSIGYETHQIYHVLFVLWQNLNSCQVC